MCYLCLTGAPTTVQEFSRVHFQAKGESVPVEDVAKEIDNPLSNHDRPRCCLSADAASRFHRRMAQDRIRGQRHSI